MRPREERPAGATVVVRVPVVAGAAVDSVAATEAEVERGAEGESVGGQGGEEEGARKHKVTAKRRVLTVLGGGLEATTLCSCIPEQRSKSHRQSPGSYPSMSHHRIPQKVG